MQLLLHITNHTELIPTILTKLIDIGIPGATVVDCKGMLASLDSSDVEPPPIFGSLRHFLDPEQKTGKILLIALKDEEVIKAKDVIHSVAGNLKRENTGILLTVPIMEWEGVPHK
jgi:hypothetical protein